MGWKVKRRERNTLIEVDEVNPLIHRGTFHIGPRHVRHHVSKEFIEHAYIENPDFASEKSCRVFAQSSNIAVEVYDFYNKLFDPDYENVSVYDERFEVQYLFKEKPSETWRSVDYYNPRVETIPLNDGVDIKKIFDTDYGFETLEITYTVRTGARLKHTIVFTNKTAQQRTFRIVMKLAGITSDKMKHGQVEERITEEKHIVAPVVFFGEDNQHLKLSEYLWSLGETNEETDEWSPTTLKNIVLDVHAQGCKADIIIGNYILAENEELLIDPDSDTWQVAANENDCMRRLTGDYWSTTIDHLRAGYNETTIPRKRQGSGARFLNVTIPKNSTITSAHFKLICHLTQAVITVRTRVSGDLSNSCNPSAYSTSADFDARYTNFQTTAIVDWDIAVQWILNTEYTRLITSVIQEIVDDANFASGNSVALFWEDFDDRSDQGTNLCERRGFSHDDTPAKAPKLEVTWTPPVVGAGMGAKPPIMELLISGVID